MSEIYRYQCLVKNKKKIKKQAHFLLKYFDLENIYLILNLKLGCRMYSLFYILFIIFFLVSMHTVILLYVKLLFTVIISENELWQVEKCHMDMSLNLKIIKE